MTETIHTQRDELAAQLIEYEYEVWQDGALQAGGRETDYARAKSEANHAAMMYAQDGPVEVRIYEKRLVAASHRSQQFAAVDGRRKGMEKIAKKTTTITETTRLELTEEQITNALLEHFGMVGGEVSFDVSSSGFLRGAQIELTRVSGSTE